MARRGCHVELQGQARVLLQHPVVDVLDALEPGQPVVVDVVRFVVEDGQFLHFAHDLAQVGVAVRCLADGLGAEGREEVVAQVVVVQRGLTHLAEVDAVDVGEKQVARGPHDAHIVLDVQRELEVVAPVAAHAITIAVVGQHRVVEEDAQAVEIGTQAVEHDDVRRDQQEVARQRRVGS